MVNSEFDLLFLRYISLHLLLWQLIFINLLEGVNTGNDEAVSPNMPDDPQDNESNDSNGNGCDSNKAKVPSVNESDPPARYYSNIILIASCASLLMA